MKGKSILLAVLYAADVCFFSVCFARVHSKHYDWTNW